MAEKEVVLTPKGLKQLEEELHYLKGTKRREVAERIKQALEFGDISENSEYDDAKNEQAFVERRIAQLEKMLRNAKVVDGDEGPSGVVAIGTWVKLKDVELGDNFEYMIVGSTEANPSEAKISHESPVGKALLGRKAGDVVEVKVPAGIVKYEILAVERR